MPAINMKQQAYIVTVNMGYGHQRASYPLADLAACPPDWEHSGSNIIAANNYPGIPKKDINSWEGSRKVYEFISRFKKVPLLGTTAFRIMDYVQRIEPFYPARDLSRTSVQLRQIYKLIHNRQWGKHLIDQLNKKPLPFVTTFFATAFFAEEHGYKGDIYCLCTDTDISRAWAPLDPANSRIKYFAPTRRVKERLMRYGVKKESIFITGFPLPKENVGHKKTNHILKKTLGCRISNLDPQGKYQKKYEKTLQQYLGKQYCNIKNKHPFTVMFAVGGAGAQRDIGITILQSLHKELDAGEMRLILVAGSRPDVYRFYEKELERLNLEHQHGESVKIIYDPDKIAYFRKFNEALLKTDVLWTKPSELSFYAGLGLPIIMSPPVGSQEIFNKTWLHSIGAGIEQRDPRYASEWLADWRETGWLAQAAMEGFMDAPRNGTYHIEDIICSGESIEIADTHLM